jgi:hypothetical protein
VSIDARVTASAAASVLVDVEVYSPSGAKVYQQFFDNQSLSAGIQKSYPVTWTVPAGTASGTYTVKLGIFSPGWGTLYEWNNGAATISVSP